MYIYILSCFCDIYIYISCHVSVIYIYISQNQLKEENLYFSLELLRIEFLSCGGGLDWRGGSSRKLDNHISPYIQEAEVEKIGSRVKLNILKALPQ